MILSKPPNVQSENIIILLWLYVDIYIYRMIDIDIKLIFTFTIISIILDNWIASGLSLTMDLTKQFEFVNSVL